MWKNENSNIYGQQFLGNHLEETRSWELFLKNNFKKWHKFSLEQNKVTKIDSLLGK